jgi:hypothetical protein
VDHPIEIVTKDRSDRRMNQVASYPHTLAKLVDRLHYKEGWLFWLQDLDRGQGSEGLTLIINLTVPDSYHPEQTMRVDHYMIVPPAAYDERSWCRWLLDQILLVEQHEACEFMRIDGHRPYAPNHGPGRNCYSIMEQGTKEDAQTTFRGERFELGEAKL